MIVPWLIFIAVGLISYAGFLKIAARLLRYSVSWRSSFFFAVIMLVFVILDHVLALGQPVAIRIGQSWCCCSVSSLWVAGFLAGHEPRRYSSWVARRHTADGAGVCYDGCCCVHDRYSRSGFSHQASIVAALANR
jgi:hypothetical protein